MGWFFFSHKKTNGCGVLFVWGGGGGGGGGVSLFLIL